MQPKENAIWLVAQKYMHGKKAMMRSSGVMRSKTVSLSLSLSLVGGFNLTEQIHNMVGLTEVVLNVVVLCGDAKFDELVLECARLLKKTVYFAFDFHIIVLV